MFLYDYRRYHLKKLISSNLTQRDRIHDLEILGRSHFDADCKDGSKSINQMTKHEIVDVHLEATSHH